MLAEPPSDIVAGALEETSDVLLALPLGDTVTILDTDTEDEPERLDVLELSAEAEAVALVLSDTDPDALHVLTAVSLALTLGDPVGLLDTGADLLGVAWADCVRLAVLEELWRGDEVPVLDTVLVGVPRADTVELLDFVELLVSSDV